MNPPVVIIDTCILLVELGVPGYAQAGPDNNRWDKERIGKQILWFEELGADFVVSIAGLVEVGNIITNNKQDKQVFVTAKRLSELIQKAVNDEDPWTAFRAQAHQLTDEALLGIASDYPQAAQTGTSMGDLFALKLVSYYRDLGRIVFLWTGDQGLQEQAPPVPQLVPRRRR